MEAGDVNAFNFERWFYQFLPIDVFLVSFSIAKGFHKEPVGGSRIPRLVCMLFTHKSALFLQKVSKFNDRCLFSCQNDLQTKIPQRPYLFSSPKNPTNETKKKHSKTAGCLEHQRCFPCKALGWHMDRLGRQRLWRRHLRGESDLGIRWHRGWTLGFVGLFVHRWVSVGKKGNGGFNASLRLGFNAKESTVFLKEVVLADLFKSKYSMDQKVTSTTLPKNL